VGFADKWLSGALIISTRKTYEDLMSFAISGTVEGHDASGTPISR
jgi:hypothetical protein